MLARMKNMYEWEKFDETTNQYKLLVFLAKYKKKANKASSALFIERLSLNQQSTNGTL